MKNFWTKSLVFSLALASLAFAGPVTDHGSLKVSGSKIVDKNNQSYQLRGMSMFWSQWSDGAKYYNAEVLNWLVDDWNVNVVRAALGVLSPSDGYLASPAAEKAKVEAIIDAAIAKDIYVIVDWHAHDNYQSNAQTFFSEIATKYAGYNNIIYEIWNEPLGQWGGDTQKWTEIKGYANAVTSTIRTKDPNALVLVGTPYYSQNVNTAANDPVADANSAYVFHFYAKSHGASERAWVDQALAANQAVFITEYGLSKADGGSDGTIDTQSAKTWLDWADANDISYVNWSVSDKGESSAALTSGASTAGGWDPASDLTASGKWVRTRYRSYPNVMGGNTSSSSVASSSSSSISAGGNTVIWEAGMTSQVFTGGYWYGYNDDSNGGSSTWSCGGVVAADGDPVDDCITTSAVSTKFNVVAGVPNGAYDPYGFVGLGFALEDDGLTKTPFDLSAATGVTLTYSSSKPMKLSVVATNAMVKDNTHFKLLAIGTNKTVTIPWAQFAQAPNWGTAVDIADIISQVREFQFQAHSDNFEGASTFSVSNFKIDGVTLPTGIVDSTSSSSTASSSVATSSSSVVSSSTVTSSSSVATDGNTHIWQAGMTSQVFTGGYWYGYNDDSNGGSSTWSCGGVVAADGDPVDDCITTSAVSTKFNVVAGVPNGAYDPYGFVGLGFALEDDGLTKTPFDLSTATGVTVTYSSSKPMKLSVVATNAMVKDNTHFKLLAIGTNKTVTIPWAQFAQAPNWGTAVDIADIISQVREFQFQAHSDNFEGASTFSVSSFTIDGIDLPTGIVGISSSSTTSSSVVTSSSIGTSSSSVVTGGDTQIWESGMTSQVYTGGYWYGYNDDANGGSSTWSCGGVVAADGDPVDDCITTSAVSTKFNVVAGVPNGVYDPYGFVGLGFALEDDGKTKTPFDLSAATGVTVTYSSSKPMKLSVVATNAMVKDNTHFKLLAIGTNKTVTIPWAEFKQAANWGTAVDIADIVSQVREFQFQAHSDNFEGASTFSVSSFKINGVSLASGIGDGTSSSSDVGTSSSSNTTGTSSSDVGTSSSSDVQVAIGHINTVINGLEVSNQVLNLYLDKANFVNVEIFSIRGSKVSSLNNTTLSAGSHQLAIPQLSRGIYVIRVNDGKTMQSLRFHQQ